VTVAVPAYNSAGTLRRCLRSVMLQTLADIEVLVTDDGSADDTGSVLAELAAEDPRIRVIRLPRNRGKPAAMNMMVDQARGAWVAVLDADDAYHPERLARLVTAAEEAGVEMGVDNILYVDGGAGVAVRTAFDSHVPPRTIGKADLAANADSFGEFDFGILKPVIRRDFLLRHRLTYHEEAKLSEDFYYLMSFFVAGGRGRLIAEPLYHWTQPFGTISRRWTTTGAGPWRYDYRNALKVNQHFIEEMTRRGETPMVALLRRRERQYTSMVHYIDAQRAAAEGRYATAVMGIALHPCTYRLLARRVAGRAVRVLRGPPGRGQPLAAVEGISR
jgi:succinoglycan biosynthesis protein ExoO